jgi:hypothetical protein
MICEVLMNNKSRLFRFTKSLFVILIAASSMLILACSQSAPGSNAAPTGLSGLTYSSMSPTYTIDLPITENVPIVTGTVTSWTISAGDLPHGLVLGSDGHITGTPDELQTATNVKIRAANSSGYRECILSITVNYEAPSGLTYASMSPTYTIDLPITENVPTVTGTVTSWTISSGDLPHGLTLGPDGHITGTPDELQTATNVIIRADNSGGYTECTLSITVNDVEPSGLTYSSMSPTYTKDAVITTNVPTVTGTVTSWNVSSGSLPEGLVLDSDGKITGTPTSTQPATDVTIRATNSGGYTEATLSIIVNYAAPVNLTYSSNPVTYTKDAVITANTPTVTGTVTLWSISSGSMPAGLNLGSDGKITGTPTSTQSATNVTIKAENSSGYTEATLSIIVNYAAPVNLTYSSNPVTYTKDAVITTNIPSVTGTVTSWTVSSGSMPAGLNLGSDGKITGTPTSTQSATNVTIRAANSGGFTDCTLSITVNYAAPTGLTYSSNPATYTLNTVITANVPTATGTVTSWSISSGSMPAGLNLGSDGQITGTPTALQSATNVTIRATNSGGYTECTISITINDVAPSALTYSSMSPTYTKDAVITANLPTVTGTVTSWSVSAGSMPTGLNLGSDGKITGTPTALQSATNVTIRATNSGGYTEATLSITVNDVAPSGLTYSEMAPTYTKNLVITSNLPTVTGTVTSWSISSGSMPAGLNLGSDGKITGTPTSTQSATNVTIKAENSGGYTEATLSIIVNYAAPTGLTYASMSPTYTLNLVISDNMPTVTGTVTSWTVSSGSMPAGLNLGSDGKITGTPTALQSATNVTIRAANSGGYTECTISITINDVAPSALTYSSMSPTYTKDAVITANLPTVTGTVVTWSVSSGSMPTGLNLGSDGKITGTPTALQSATNVTIRATNSGGYTEATLSITVNDVAPSGLTYSEMAPTYTKNLVITSNLPTVTGTVVTWTVSSGSMPAGLNLGSDGKITGTPTSTQSATNVTIRAANSGGYTECTISITVNYAAPINLTYSFNPVTYTKDEVITENIPTVTGTVTTWSISSGSMPAGLNLGSDGKITGTPTAVQSATNVTIRATNSGGYTEATLSVTVNDVAPSGLTYASMSPTYTKDAVITANLPTVTGTVVTWSVSSGSMPTGLNLGSDGKITGTPTALQSATNVTIRAANSGGYTEATLSITVNYAAPTGLTYASMSPIYTLNLVITANLPTVTGTVTSWTVSSGFMPAGLNLGSDGKITGTPTALQSATNVTIKAENSGGYSEATLSITVNYEAPTGLTYASMSPTYTKDAVITANLPTVTGTVTSWTVSSGSMPAGLNLGSDGKITGTPTATQSATNVTIKAENSGGYTEATLSIIVNYAAPTGLTYASMSPTYTKDAVITANLPTVTGTVTSWSVSAGSMPTGLNLGSDGKITGTPTSTQSATNVTIKAENSGGYTEATLSIIVNYAAPTGLTYASMSPTYTKDAVITANLPTVTGTITSWTVSAGSMPAGLNLGSDGKITGTPTSTQSATNVTIKAENSGGYTEATLSITVNYAAPTGLTYSSNPATYTLNTVITANVPTVTGTVTSWSISSGSMPVGLNLGSDGQITGTPTALQSSTDVTIRATNSGGSTDCVISITVNDAAPTNLTYSSNPAAYTINLVISDNMPSVTGTVVSYAVYSGSLPTGLSLNVSTGHIYGTPTALQSATNVTIRATNSGGSTDCVVSIAVNYAAPTGLTYSLNPAVYIQNAAITTNTPSVTGTVTSWTVSSGSLPTGLSLGGTGNITGTPTTLQAATNVTIRATNSGGYTECTLSIAVKNISWTARVLATSETWSSVVYGAAATPEYVAVGNNTRSNYTTNIGTTAWASQNSLPKATNQAVAYGGTPTAYFVTIASGARNVATSTNGSGAWTNNATSLPSATTWKAIGYGNNYFVVVANGPSTAAAYALSTGLAAFTASTLQNSLNWSSVAYGSGVFVAIANGSAVTNTSATNGATWITHAASLPSAAAWTSVAYGSPGGKGLFVAVASGSTAAATSTDGITWTARTLSASAAWTSVTYGNGIFVAVASGSTNSSVSPDGITWTTKALTASTAWSCVAYGSGYFVTVGGTTNSNYTSF